MAKSKAITDTKLMIFRLAVRPPEGRSPVTHLRCVYNNFRELDGFVMWHDYDAFLDDLIVFRRKKKDGSAKAIKTINAAISELSFRDKTG